MTAPVATPAEPTHDAVTSTMLRHRRLLGTVVLLGLTLVGLYVVVSLLRARTQPWLGLQTHRFEGSVFTRAPQGGASTVRVVRQGSPAARAGMQPGDRVLTIDGTAADNVRALVERHQRLQPGDRVDYVIEREGHRQTRTLTVAPLLHERRQWVGVAVRVLLVFALFLGIPAVVYKWRPDDPRALLFMLFSNTFGLSMLNFAVPGSGRPPESVIPMPDAYAHVNAVGVLLTYVCALVVSPTLLHFLALFPKPRLGPQALARALRWTYLMPAAAAWVASPVCVLVVTRQLPRPAGTWASAGVALVCALGAVMLWRARRRQTEPNVARWFDQPLLPVAASALLFTALALLLFAAVQLF